MCLQSLTVSGVLGFCGMDNTLEWGPKCRFIWRVEQLFIIYEDTVATCSASRAGLLSRAKPIQARLSGDST